VSSCSSGDMSRALVLERVSGRHRATPLSARRIPLQPKGQTHLLGARACWIVGAGGRQHKVVCALEHLARDPVADHLDRWARTASDAAALSHA
jgi:hypothetical protein